MSGTGKIINLLNDSDPQGRRYKCLVGWTFRMTSYCELKLCEEKGPSSLSVIEPPCAAKVFQVAMVSEN